MTGDDSVTAPGFAEVYRAQWPFVTRFVAVRVRRGDGHLVEDLTQATFLRAWRSWPGRHANDPPWVQGWLCTIARRVVCDHYRGGSGRQWAVEFPADPTTAPLWRGSRVASPDDTDRVGALVDLGRSMQSASAAHRQAVQLRVVDGLARGRRPPSSMRRGKAAVRRLVAEVIES